ncbi:hypothetical protein K504DRAFT_462849 [Pleomassaria siparia CBS 279.74]|uniref:Uncharacterized protein n=1 Tax=Pleomassaria siparia CBS 279.74 TaxID=1314801 RepID=A0A6G1JVN6_9PLEO|nr:hypothetical protein K504DRAFT_462849 [Pleomassaria siparia CBS 279.74]
MSSRRMTSCLVRSSTFNDYPSVRKCVLQDQVHTPHPADNISACGLIRNDKKRSFSQEEI